MKHFKLMNIKIMVKYDKYDKSGIENINVSWLWQIK